MPIKIYRGRYNVFTKLDQVFAKKCAYHIDRLFRPMNIGSLRITLPDGEVWKYGLGDGNLHATIHVHDWQFFKKCVLYGAVGFGESYVEGDWDTDDITKVISWMIINYENHPTLSSDKKKAKQVNFFGMFNRWMHRMRENSLLGSKKNISEHYDLSNDFFKTFLDPTLAYSSAYFKKPQQSLEEAQGEKFDQLCQKLKLKPSDHLLEIGSGWGGMAIHAVKQYGCRVTTVTISQEQYKYAKQRFAEEGLTDRITILLKDYRLLEGQYDKIVSIEMIEAVGDKYLPAYFEKLQSLLKKNGLLALQMILFPDHRYEISKNTTDWIQKHIFPGSLLPSVGKIQECLQETGTLNLYHYEDITPHYAKTLRLWFDAFNQEMQRVKELGYSEAFVRKWNYYLCYCEAAFKTRNISVAQAVYSRPNNLSIDDDLTYALSETDKKFFDHLQEANDVSESKS